MPLLETKGAGSAQGFGLTVGKSAPVNYIEDVFSTYLYTGSDAPQTIQNNIDLLNNGGLVWFKHRSGTPSSGYDKHILFDTQRGNNVTLSTSNTAANETGWGDIYLRFRNNGFDTGTGAATNQQYLNKSGVTYASWTFRKQPKFFDVVTYTGNGAQRNIAHSLGSAPGCIMVKRTDGTGDWAVWHRSLAAGDTDYLLLNTTAAKATDLTYWYGSGMTSTTFAVGTNANVNASGGTYVAYLFAHDAGGFGPTGTDNVISCGSVSHTNGNNTTVNLGWEPQFIIARRSDTAANWEMYDTMRGWVAPSGSSANLKANSSAAEASGNGYFVNSTGFQLNSALSTGTYIYIAIRRGPMKTPTTGASVFDIDLNGNSTAPAFTSGFPVDFNFMRNRTQAEDWYAVSRLTGDKFLWFNKTDAQLTDTAIKFDYQNGSWSATYLTAYTGWNFRRAPGFFDVVCYTGNGSASYSVAHNLRVVPELAIIKRRDAASSFGWFVVRQPGFGNDLLLNSNGTGGYNALDSWSSSNFSLASGSADINASGGTYVAYLFASCPGVSKVGTFFLGGSPMTIDCGFTSGARFVLIKNTNYSGGSWWVWDTARGIGAGIDPRLSLDSGAAEDTTRDWLTPNSTGFATTQAFSDNWSGGNFIYLAIA